MARDQSGDAALTPEEATAVERIRRKRLGEDGCPQDRPDVQNAGDGEESALDKPENEQPGFIDTMRGM